MNNHKDRKKTRLAGYDYAQDGHYFITICSKNREEFFGKIVNGRMALNELGMIVENQWLWLAGQYDYVRLDEYVIMPNHVHGILVIDNCWPVGTGRDLSLPSVGKTKSVSELIGAFKTTSSKLIHLNGLEYFFWQRSFYDHIIRNESALNNIREYIANNPLNWALEKDRDHLLNIDL